MKFFSIMVVGHGASNNTFLYYTNLHMPSLQAGPFEKVALHLHQYVRPEV